MTNQETTEKVAAMIQMREQDRARGDTKGTCKHPKWSEGQKQERMAQAAPIVALVRQGAVKDVLRIMEEWGLPRTTKTLNWGDWNAKYGDVSLQTAIHESCGL